DGAAVTTIDASGIGGSVVTCDSREGAQTAIEGFTITGGMASGFARGGGMNNYMSGPTITNCLFVDNTAGYGGAMYNQGASPTITACTFAANHADGEGGAI